MKKLHEMNLDAAALKAISLTRKALVRAEKARLSIDAIAELWQLAWIDLRNLEHFRPAGGFKEAKRKNKSTPELKREIK